MTESRSVAETIMEMSAPELIVLGVSAGSTLFGAATVLAGENLGALPCVFRDSFSVPCPFCGLTRTAKALALGQETQFDSLWQNLPASLVVVALGLTTVAGGLSVIGRRPIGRGAANLLLSIVCSLLVTNWAIQVVAT
jgi:hypothetical protein